MYSLCEKHSGYELQYDEPGKLDFGGIRIPAKFFQISLPYYKL